MAARFDIILVFDVGFSVALLRLFVCELVSSFAFDQVVVLLAGLSCSQAAVRWTAHSRNSWCFWSVYEHCWSYSMPSLMIVLASRYDPSKKDEFGVGVLSDMLAATLASSLFLSFY